MPNLILMCGPPGSGKDTFINSNIPEFVLVSQDLSGKQGHMDIFNWAIKEKKNIAISRMNFNKEQRSRYLKPAKEAGYETEIIVLHQNYETCLNRCVERVGHPTIEYKDEKSAKSALQTFFTKYERPTEDEANKVTFIYPTPSLNLNAIICDIDGTAANIDHRQHFVDKSEGKKPDWKSFFSNMDKDLPNEFCREIVNGLSERNCIVFCSGRPDSYRKVTQEWLNRHKFRNDNLFMRPRNDFREDSIIKEIILDFELKTRYNNIKFVLDDRSNVTKMWRRRGLVCLQVAPGDF